MVRKLSMFVAIAAFVVTGWQAPASAKKVLGGKGKALVLAYIYHPAKKILAGSRKLSGEVKFGAKTGSTTALSGSVTIPVKSLRSGNARRDNYMRNSLGIKANPTISFAPKSITEKAQTVKKYSWKASKRKPVKCTHEIKGTFTINGKNQDVTVAAKVVNKGGKTRYIIPNLVLKVTDFGIVRPSLGPAKIKNEVHLRMLITLE